MQRLYTLTLAMFIIAMMSLSLAPVMAQEDGWVSSSVVINDDDDDPYNPFISGSAWIGNFSYSPPNDNNNNTASIYAEHAYYAHHYSTEDKVNYSLTFKLQVNESPNYIHEHGANGQMDEHHEEDAMPQNYISSLTYTYVDVTSLARLPGNAEYTAIGYTFLSITNPDGDDLNVKSNGTWKFTR